MPRGVGLLLCCWAMACAAPAAAPPSEPAPAAKAPPPEAPPPKSSPSLKALPEAHSDFPLSVSREDRASFERVLEAPVRAIAIDKEPHVSALGERTVHVHDRKGWREEDLPPMALGDAALALFYGRDYRVRLVGTRLADAGLETLYYRWLPGGFRPAPDEIGRLGNTRKGGFVSLLGTADPEVVCRPGEICLVKRVSGWATITAPANIELVAIDGGEAWAVAGKTLLKVEADKRWTVVSETGPWSKANALWVKHHSVWVIETETSKLHELTSEGWRSSASPAKQPHAFWTQHRTVQWLGGEDGLFCFRQFDTKEWRKVPSVPGAVWAIAAHPGGSSPWVGGSAGLFREIP